MNIISVRVTDDEKQMLEQAKDIYNCGVSTLLKKIVFEKLSDDFDLKIIEEYENKKKNNNLEYIEIDDVWKELGI